MHHRAILTIVEVDDIFCLRVHSWAQQTFRRGIQTVTHATHKLLGDARWLILPALLCCVLSMQARAQNDNAPVSTASPMQAEPTRPGEGAMKLLPQLNLSDEQRTQLVAIARQHNEDSGAAQMRLRQARRALNLAIYAENPDQNVVSERARDVANAQEAVIRLNAQTELKVRQLLTTEQLRTFRRLRNEQRRDRQQQRQLEGDNPRGERRNRLPGMDQPPNAQPNNGGNPAPADTMRERRRQRRQQLPGAGRVPRP